MKWIGLIAAAALLAGCSQSTDDPSDARRTDRPTTPLEELVLDESAFPAGAEHIPVTEEDLSRASDQLADALASAEVTPEKCVNTQRDMADALDTIFADSANAAYAADGLLYVEFVTSEPVAIEDIVATASGECETVAAKFEVEGDAVETESRSELLDRPADYGDDEAVALRIATTTTVNSGAASALTQLSGYAVVRGLTVGVQVNSLDPSHEPDVDEFRDLFEAAIAKVEQQD